MFIIRTLSSIPSPQQPPTSATMISSTPSTIAKNAGKQEQVYVVYVYVDYRKEIGTQVLRAYSSSAEAVGFARAISVDYKSPEASNNERGPSDDEDNDEREYNMIGGDIFDSRLRCQVDQLGVEDADTVVRLKRLWMLRVAVSGCKLY
jgi:hypothetical protein